MADSIQRFGLNGRINPIVSLLHSSVSFITLIAFLICTIEYFELFNLNYSLEIYLFITINGLSQLILSYYRGSNNVKFIALFGFIESILIIGSMTYILGIDPSPRFFFIGQNVAKGSVLILQLAILRLELLKNLLKLNFSIFKKLLFFSAPLIINGLGWWFNNLSDRFLIVRYLGTAENGIYAIAFKVSFVIFTFGSILVSSWSILALQPIINPKEKISFIRFFHSLKYISLGGLVILTPYLNKFLIDESYEDAILLIPGLSISAYFMASSLFYGVYQLKEGATQYIALTTFIAGLINVILNITLLEILGLNGAIISTLISSYIIYTMRYIKSQEKYFEKKDKNQLWYSTMLLLSALTTVYLNSNYFNQILGLIILSIGLSIIYKERESIYRLTKTLKR